MAEEIEKMRRYSSNAMDALIGVRHDVLNGRFVRLIDYMGGDESVVQSARISYGSGTKRVREDEALIRYLMRHRHTSPFEMCELKLHVRVPMDTWRQWIRHRTANVNEYSTRYSVAIDAAMTTQADDWRKQAESNRQGSGAALSKSIGERLSADEADIHRQSRAVYKQRLEEGVAREQARKDLPLSTYTEAYWKIDLHNLLNFLALRLDERAQLEIRAYADVIGNQIVRIWCPLVWQAFLDYRLNATTFSRLELELLGHIVSRDESGAQRLAARSGLVTSKGSKKRKSRELVELEEKLKNLGIDGYFDKWL